MQQPEPSMDPPASTPSNNSNTSRHVACLPCRHRRKKCDGGTPCSRCLHLHIENQCEYLARKRPNPSSTANHAGDASTGPSGAASAASAAASTSASESSSSHASLSLSLPHPHPRSHAHPHPQQQQPFQHPQQHPHHHSHMHMMHPNFSAMYAHPHAHPYPYENMAFHPHPHPHPVNPFHHPHPHVFPMPSMQGPLPGVDALFSMRRISNSQTQMSSSQDAQTQGPANAAASQNQGLVQPGNLIRAPPGASMDVYTMFPAGYSTMMYMGPPQMQYAPPPGKRPKQE